MSFVWPFGENSVEPVTLETVTPGFPAPLHPAEADLFARQAQVPNYDMNRIRAAHVGVVGCGGLGSWIALGLARAGVTQLTLFDGDAFERTNAPRQLMFGSDVGSSKAHALARNIVPHMMSTGRIRATADSWSLMRAQDVADVDLLVVGVDRNDVRLDASQWGLMTGKPVLFAALSLDGLRAQVFAQFPGGPCLRCVLPDLSGAEAIPCAAASIASCYLVGGHVVHTVLTTLSGSAAPTWRETSLDGTTERALSPARRANCFCDEKL